MFAFISHCDFPKAFGSASVPVLVGSHMSYCRPSTPAIERSPSVPDETPTIGVPLLRRRDEEPQHNPKTWSAAGKGHLPLPFLQQGFSDAGDDDTKEVKWEVQGPATESLPHDMILMAPPPSVPVNNTVVC